VDGLKALVTGAGGFVGSHLVEWLVQSGGPQLHATVFGDSLQSLPPALAARLALHQVDLRSEGATADLFESVRPTHVFHLAGPSEVGDSFLHPAETIESMVLIAVRVLESALKLPERPRVLFVSSAEVYASSEMPLTEEAPTQPDSPYAVGKLACESYAGLMARRGLPVVVVRPFNHVGPRQSEKFVCAGFAKQIAEIEAGLREPVVRVGNLAARRDFSDVRDVVRAYPMLLDRGEVGSTWNVASGTAVRISDLLSGLVAISTTKVRVEVDPSRLRAIDRQVMLGDASRLLALGWSPSVSFAQTLRDTLDYWRQEMAQRPIESAAEER
jgi:GDP-4-dehydro-6-deoxy-D-mannose reductase